MKLGEGDLRAVLGRVAELARQTLPGMAGASVTLVESDRAFTAAFAGQLALDLDETQYQEGFGPCLEVAQSAGTVSVPDMAAETRWPVFARQALAAGVRSSLSVALPLQEAVLGALNLYATQPAAFDQDAIEMARTFAGYAAIAIANARLYQSTAALAENMRRAMETRAVIEQAKGILVAQQHCTPEQAFELLTRLSQTTHRKLRDCAADLVASTAGGSSLADRPLHLKLDQPVQLERVFHRQFARDRLDEAAHDGGRGLILGHAAAHQVEQLVLGDLGDACLVAHLDVVFADVHVGIGVGPADRVHEQRVALDRGFGVCRTLLHLDQPPVGRAAAGSGHGL